MRRLLAVLIALTTAPPRALPVETLTSTAALPAHLAGAIGEITACEQTPDGRYFVFDRRAHTVYTVPPTRDQVRKLVEIGAEPGRVLRPTAFDVANDETLRLLAKAALAQHLAGSRFPGVKCRSSSWKEWC